MVGYTDPVLPAAAAAAAAAGDVRSAACGHAVGRLGRCLGVVVRPLFGGWVFAAVASGVVWRSAHPWR